MDRLSKYDPIAAKAWLLGMKAVNSDGAALPETLSKAPTAAVNPKASSVIDRFCGMLRNVSTIWTNPLS